MLWDGLEICVLFQGCITCQSSWRMEDVPWCPINLGFTATHVYTIWHDIKIVVYLYEPRSKHPNINLVGRGWKWTLTCTEHCKTLGAPPKKLISFKCITFMMEHPGRSWLQRSGAFFTRCKVSQEVAAVCNVLGTGKVRPCTGVWFLPVLSSGCTPPTCEAFPFLQICADPQPRTAFQNQWLRQRWMVKSLSECCRSTGSRRRSRRRRSGSRR